MLFLYYSINKKNERLNEMKRRGREERKLNIYLY